MRGQVKVATLMTLKITTQIAAISMTLPAVRSAPDAAWKYVGNLARGTEELCVHLGHGWSCDLLRDATELYWPGRNLTAAHLETLGMLVATLRPPCRAQARPRDCD